MTENGPPPPPSTADAHIGAAALSRAWHHIRNRLIEGILVLLPILITFWMLWWLYSLLDRYAIHPLAALVLLKTRLLPVTEELPYWFETYGAPLIGGALALVIVYCCGILAHSRVRRLVDEVLLRLPVVSHLYDGVRNVFQCFNKSGEKQPTPQRIVLVPFPHPGMRLPAIVTAVSRDIATDRVVLCVYVPTTPIPTSGFFLMIPEDEVTELNWNVQQTLQAIISGGLTAPPHVSYTKTMSPGTPADLTKGGG
jgi:uncharacterized membrane protein